MVAPVAAGVDVRIMSDLHDQPVQELLEQPNYAVVSTLNEDGSIHNTIVWVSAEDGTVAVNSAMGRKWPTNLERDPRVNVLVYEAGNPYNFVEIRGTRRTGRPTAPTSTSTRWPRSTSTRTSIPTGSRASSGSSS